MRLVFTCHVRCIKRWKLNVGSSNPIWAHRAVPCLSFTLKIHKREACVRTAKVRQLYETMCVYTENLQTGSHPSGVMHGGNQHPTWPETNAFDQLLQIHLK